MKSQNGRATTIFWCRFGAGVAPVRAERQVGEAGRDASTPGWNKSPPQAIENRKIIDVSVWGKSGLFSAGKGLAEM
jgi:hypothetical protein